METGLFASEVSSALPSPTIALVTPETVPVNVGLALGAKPEISEGVTDGVPPAVDPLCTRMPSVVVSTVTSPTAPVNASFSKVEPLRNCTCFAMS